MPITFQTIDDIIHGNLAFSDKMAALVAIETDIEREYANGNTSILPVSFLTVDDLLSL